MNEENLPEIVQELADNQPDVWSAYNQLGQAIGGAGPLAPETQRLIKLALAIGAGLEGAVHSHTHRGLEEGLTGEQMRHVALLGVTTLGWPRAVAGLSWIDAALAENQEPKR